MTAAPVTAAPVPAADAERLLANLHREHRSVLMAHATRLTGGDHAWAEDVVQETFIRAWRRLDRMTEEHGSVRSWLMRVAHNVAVDGHRVRRARPVPVEETEAGLEPVHDTSGDVLAAMQVDDALAVLGRRHRDVLEDVYLRDHTFADTARRLGIPVGTVKSRVFYGLHRLRDSVVAQACLTD